MKQFKYIFYVSIAVIVLNSCSPAKGDFPGSEYMPDMAHSVAYEPNVYINYKLNTWDSASTFKLKELSTPRLPVKGTVPRGYAGVYFADEAHRAEVMASLRGNDGDNSIAVPVNGHVPFYYENTEEERTRATAEIIANPFPITAAGLEKGEELYNIYCGICHGEKGDGQGYLVSEANPNAKYPAAPANFLLEDLVNSSNGRYYYSIMYGKNVMGAYKDKLDYEERWQVIHWIRALQAKELKLQYDQDGNTLNAAYGTPGGQMERLAENATDAAPAPEAAHDDASHGDGH